MYVYNLFSYMSCRFKWQVIADHSQVLLKTFNKIVTTLVQCKIIGNTTMRKT